MFANCHTLLSIQRRSFRQWKRHQSRSGSKSRQRRPCSPNSPASARASTAQWFAIWILGHPAKCQSDKCSWVRAHGIHLALSPRIHRSFIRPGRKLNGQHVNDDYLRKTKWEMSKVCAYPQLHRDFRLLVWLENCLIRLATMNRADCHVKFQDRSRDAKAVGVQNEDSMSP